MKLTILLLSVSLAFLTSCTTSYKTGQTPDDVYYSPERAGEEYVRTENDREPRYNDEYYEDRYLRMKVRNRTRWSDLDDWYYSDYRNRYNVYLGCCMCESNWSPYSNWNTYYNPYYQNYVIIKNVKSPVYTRPRNFNLNAYNPSNQQNTQNYTNPKYNSATSNSSNNNNSYTPRTNNNNNNGNRLREIFRSENSGSSSSSNSSSTPSSSNSSSSSSSSGSSGGSKSGSSGSSAPVRRF